MAATRSAICCFERRTFMVDEGGKLVSAAGLLFGIEQRVARTAA
jgi:hypothetical protein